MHDVARIISKFRKEADVDFIELPHIASAVQYGLGLRSQQEIRHYALEVVRGLMARGVYPGDYTLESLAREGFQFWTGEPDRLLKRIEADWISLGKMPDLEHSICWFALRSAEVV